MQHRVSWSVSGLFLALFLFVGPAAAQRKVVCIGDSITYGSRLPDRERNHYPAQLGWRLGAEYEVVNGGQGGHTLLSAGDRPYVKSGSWTYLIEGAPDVAVVILGTNDTCQGRRGNWEHEGELETDARAMVAALRSTNAEVRVLLCTPTPIFPEAPGLEKERKADLTERAPRLGRIAEALQSVASSEGVEFVDLSRVLTVGQVVDGVHPNSFGAEAIANRIAEAIVTPRAPGLDLEAALAKKGITAMRGEYHRFERFDFPLPDGPSCTLVAPHVAAAGRPWLWRMRFFGHEPALELDLLDRGFHLAYVDLANLYGSPSALARMEPFHALLAELGLSNQPVLMGMSRGGLPLLAWANAHPEGTAALYGDNPVGDLGTWPGGRGGKRSDADWARTLDVFGWSEEDAAEAGDFLLRGLDAPIRAGVPLFLVQGLADEVVPAEQNGLRLANLWREGGGRTVVWPKPNANHHPHGLHPPAPLVREIRQACGLGGNPATRATPSAEHRGKPAGWGGGTWWGQLDKLQALGKVHPDTRVVFFGDSITQGLTGSGDRVARKGGERAIDEALGEYGALSLGLSGDRTEHLLFRIEHGALASIDPEVIVLQIGVNNVNAAKHTARETAEGIEAVVTRLREREPQAHVVICGPFPAGVEVDDPRRAVVNEIHARIVPLGERAAVTYLDLRSLFLEEDGRANDRLSEDGIHVTGAGQRAWMSALVPIVKRITSR